MKIALAESKGKKSLHTVQPLKDTPTPPPPVEPTAEDVATCTDVATLGRMWHASGPERRKQIEARVEDLKMEPGPDETLESGAES